MFSIANWLGDFSCGGLVVNNLKEKKLLSNQMNNNHFRLILVRKYLHSFTMENLRCPTSSANKKIYKPV